MNFPVSWRPRCAKQTLYEGSRRYKTLRSLAILYCSILFFAGSPSCAEERASGIFGVFGHFLNVPTFFPSLDDSWSLSGLQGPLDNLGVHWIGTSFYAYADPTRTLLNLPGQPDSVRKQVEKRRSLLESYFSQLDNKGFSISLTIFGRVPSDEKASLINNLFFDWVTEFIGRHPSVKIVQLHNEPNLRFFWPKATPLEYVETYRDVAKRIRQVRPDVKIAGGAISSLSWPNGRRWLDRAIDSGLLEIVDGISIHPYTNSNAPEDDPFFKTADRGLSRTESAFLSFATYLRNHQPHGSKPIDIFVTEVGYSTSPRGLLAVGSEDRQAAFLSRSIILFASMAFVQDIPIRTVIWYDLKDDGRDAKKEQHNFGLLDYNGKRKKASFETYRRTLVLLNSVENPAPSPYRINSLGDKRETYVRQFFSEKSESTLVALWHVGPDVREMRDETLTIYSPHKCNELSIAKTVVEQTSIKYSRLDFEGADTGTGCTVRIGVHLSGEVSFIRIAKI